LLHKLLREQPRLKTDVAEEVIHQLIEKGGSRVLYKMTVAPWVISIVAVRSYAL
ncbi:hypothetical protein Pmar_PMAR025228, partial [Perkinsus marinus ATCC 50983]